MSEAGDDLPWHSAAEIVAARCPGLSERQVERLAPIWRERFPDRARKRAGKGGCWEYRADLLPEAARFRLAAQAAGSSCDTPSADDRSDRRSKALWAAYEALSKRQKDECARRLNLVEEVDRLQRHHTASAAVAMVSARGGVAPATLWRWLDMTRAVPRADWLAALAPGYRKTAEFADCDPRAWRAFLSDYLRPEAPGFSACYRRMAAAAAREGWSPLPSERALRRRLKAEVSVGELTIAREGADAAKRLYPAQRRSRAGLEAMAAVNVDGHKFDVFVKFADGRIGRPVLVAFQDIYSGKFLSWRHAETENKGAVRLAIGDMVERYGVPDAIYLDNGRAFASKWITGGAPNRFRFKVRDEDPQGLLVTLGVEIHWTTPYSGQSKPIERAFRDLCEEIAKHPFCAGAYVGASPEAKPENYGDRAIPFDEFKAFADRQIAEHNARPGRRTETAQGRSCDETFAASMETAIVRWPTNAQRHLWLLAAECVTARKGSGEIHLFGNRYWAPALNQWAGRKVTVRFDPDALKSALKVYGPDDAFICDAVCVDDAGFASAEAARSHAKARRDYIRSMKESEAMRERMRADELAELYAQHTNRRPSRPGREGDGMPGVKRIAVAGRRSADAARQQDEAMDQDEFEAAFARGLRVLSGGA